MISVRGDGSSGVTSPTELIRACPHDPADQHGRRLSHPHHPSSRSARAISCGHVSDDRSWRRGHHGQDDRWAALARTIITQLESSPSHLIEELLAGRASAYLTIEGRPRRSDQRRAPSAPGTPWRPRYVNQAIRIMEADPSAICSMADLAEATKVSVRTLQAGFSQHTGTSPMGYLRQLRLARVHQDLLAADPRHHTVAPIAHRHGFQHLGRFAATYRSAYGCNPSATLRLSAPQQPAVAHGGAAVAAADVARLVITVRCGGS